MCDCSRARQYAAGTHLSAVLHKIPMKMSLKPRSILKWTCFAFIAIIVVEMVIINASLIALFMVIKSEISSVANAPGSSILDKLMHNRRFQELVDIGKDGGFSKLMQETLGRLYIVSDPLAQSRDARAHRFPQLSVIGLDVSNAGEAVYIYRRIQSRSSFPYHRLVVDIGAHDGLLSSNSYNFVEWGWSAILVEPLASQISRAKVNIHRHLDRYGDGNQTVTFVKAVLSNKDDFVEFVVKPGTPMESHILKDFKYEQMKDEHKNPMIVNVQSMTVRTFSRTYNVPKNFGILSVDAEGEGDIILHQWIDLGFRPAYIVYEQLHNREKIEKTVEYLEAKDYHYLTKLGWNYLFEHIPRDS